MVDKLANAKEAGHRNVVREDTGNEPRLGSGQNKGSSQTARGRAGGRKGGRQGQGLFRRDKEEEIRYVSQKGTNPKSLLRHSKQNKQQTQSG